MSAIGAIADRHSSTSSWIGFFAEQRTKADGLERWRLVLTVGLGAALLVLLIAFKSPGLVWVYVAVLFSASYAGLRQVQRALDAAKAAFADLGQLAKLLEGNPARIAVEQYVNSKIAPDDSNVPEAIAALLLGHQTGEGIRAAANASLSQPASRLTLAHYLRTLLILGGLFGTVLFFAFQLGGKDLAGGDYGSMLAGLQGALASTLTGILGSIALGFLASRTDQLIDRSVWETESLFGGPLARALAAVPQERSLRNETDLWQALLEEVRHLRTETAESYEKLAADVGAYALALKEVSTQLTELPQVQVPPQLSKLEDVVAEFSSGAKSLGDTAKVLVEAVGKVGVTAPTAMLRSLAGLQSSVDDAQRRASTDIQALGGGVKAVEEVVVARSEAIEGQLSRLPDGTAQRVATTLEPLRESVEGVSQELQRLRAALEGRAAPGPSGEPVGHPEQLARIETKIDSAITSLRPAADGITTLEGASEKIAGALDSLKSDVGSIDTALRGVGAKLGYLERTAAWLERANRAPLMRLLTLPWSRSRRPEARHGAQA